MKLIRRSAQLAIVGMIAGGALAIPATAFAISDPKEPSKVEVEAPETITELNDRAMAAGDAIAEYFRNPKSPDYEKYYENDFVDGTMIVYHTDVLTSESEEAATKAASAVDLPVKFSTVDISATQWYARNLNGHEKLKSEFPDVLSVAIDAQDLGLRVTLLEGSKTDKDRVASRFSELIESKLPVTIDYASEPTFNAGRKNDVSPYTGGGRLRFNLVEQGPGLYDTNQCTAGFAAVKNATGTRVMTTAKHCKRIGDFTAIEARNGGSLMVSNSFMGNGNDSFYLLPFSGRTFEGSVFSGGPASTTGRVVQNANSPSMSTTSAGYVSGGFAGETAVTFTHFGATVTPSLTGTTTFNTAFRYESVTGLRRLGVGDSGSPVYSVHTTGNATIRGMHNGGWSSTGPCYGGADDRLQPSSCSYQSWGFTVNEIEDQLNVTTFIP